MVLLLLRFEHEPLFLGHASFRLLLQEIWWKVTKELRGLKRPQQAERGWAASKNALLLFEAN
jgi:hypothetical protein